MSFGEVEHFATMVAGCECINHGDTQSGDARYAFAVLKLHAVDFGGVAGQEGFLDNVKSGAKKTGEFIKKLFAAIKKWFADVFKAVKNKVTSVFKSADEKQRAAMRDKLRSSVTPKIEALKTASENLPDGVKADGFGKLADKAIESMDEKSTPGEVVNGINNLLDAIDRVSNSFVAYCQARMPKVTDESTTEYDDAVKHYKQWGEKANALTMALAQGARAQVDSK